MYVAWVADMRFNFFVRSICTELYFYYIFNKGILIDNHYMYTFLGLCKIYGYCTCDIFSPLKGMGACNKQSKRGLKRSRVELQENVREEGYGIGLKLFFI